ncbi:MAG: DUF1924 domain-containing protein [Helicobacter sp.]|nr:DUF1924 domain-containing protein [Helicobacter sp.]
MKKIIWIACVCSLSAATLNQSMQSYIESLKVEAKSQDSAFVDFSASEGQKIFTTQNIGRDNQKLSCESCHGSNLQQNGRNVFTNKVLPPLAPSANAESLSDPKQVQKWLKRNFKDVYLREGSAKEKGDVLYYILTK